MKKKVPNKHNPIARLLASTLNRQRIIKKKNKYDRKRLKRIVS